MQFLCIIIVAYQVALSTQTPWEEGECGPCFCRQENDKYGTAKYTVNCSSRGLTSIPLNLPVRIHILDLSGNDLRNTNSLANLKKYGGFLFSLSLAGNKISRLDPSILNSIINLEVLDLTGIVLDSADGSHFQMLNLRKLIGMHARKYLNRFVGLEVLTIVFESTHISSDVFDELQVFQLEVTFRAAKQLPESIFKFGTNTLTTLSITGQYIVNLPENLFKGLSVLKTLYIEGENIRWLPETLFFKPSLKNMPVHLYDLTVIGVQSISRNLLQKQQSLRYAKLRRIDDLPPLNLPSQLDILDLRDSNVITIPPNIYSKLNNLRQLILSNTSLSYLEEKSLYGLLSLSFLDLSENKLSALPVGLFQSCIHSLEILDLSHNRISNITKSYFSSVTSLQVLDLSHNTIAVIDENAFENLNILSNLKLTDNSINQLPEILFKNVFSLKEVHLNRNEITVIPRNIFKHSRNLLSANLDENPLICDCNIFEIKQEGRFLKILGTCNAPLLHRGKSVEKFAANLSVCSETTATEPLTYSITTSGDLNDFVPNFNYTVPILETSNKCDSKVTVMLYISCSVLLSLIIVVSFVFIRKCLAKLRQKGDYVLPPPTRIPFTMALNNSS